AGQPGFRRSGVGVRQQQDDERADQYDALEDERELVDDVRARGERSVSGAHAERRPPIAPEQPNEDQGRHDAHRADRGEHAGPARRQPEVGDENGECGRGHGCRGGDGHPVDGLGGPDHNATACQTGSTSVRTRPGHTPSRTIHGTRGAHVIVSGRLPSPRAGNGGPIVSSPGHTRRTVASRYRAVRTSPTRATSSRPRKYGRSSTWAGRNVPMIASNSPQNPASPGNPSEAMAANVSSAANLGSRTYMPPPRPANPLVPCRSLMAPARKNS